MMMACQLGWKEGVWELLRNEASLTATSEGGLTAREIAVKCKKREIVEMIDDWLRPDDEPVEETYVMQQKREDIESSKARRAEEAKKDETAGIDAKAQMCGASPLHPVCSRASPPSDLCCHILAHIHPLAEQAPHARILHLDKLG